MAFRKGGKKPQGSGRKKGTPNETTREVKEMLRQALTKAGGVAYLTRCAKNPRTASSFLALIGKLIPHEIKAQLEGEGRFVVGFERSFVGGPKGESEPEAKD